ncbi:MAG: N-acetyl-gamma-glutamyl-phosphate reductase [Gammaproteobacteria bacterium]|nr:MAG: N-acetyl-gamma-glutamyl-phosphate reductase [Gammaproteobacteria bacterium]
MSVKVGILGATGYTGLELIRLLINHPQMELAFAGSQSSKGKRLKEIFPFLEGFKEGDLILEDYKEIPQDVKLLFLALPHEVSMEIAPQLLERGFKVVDLSGAYRFKNLPDYETFYGFKHTHPEVLQKAVYGLTEVFREEIKNADLVANPGCYPTATLLALYPLLKNPDLIEEETINVVGLSGVSGAGRGLKQHFHFPEMTDNMFAYKVTMHRHTPEMEFVANSLTRKGLKFRFTPAVVPIDRGMLSIVTLKVKKTDLRELYEETYRGEEFVKVVDYPPKSKEVIRTNYCFVYPSYDERTQRAVIVSAIDNLVKGASGQALQNANLMLGLDEGEGLRGLIPSAV